MAGNNHKAPPVNPWQGLRPIQKVVAVLVSRWVKHWRTMLMFLCTLGIVLAVTGLVVHMQGRPGWGLCFIAPFAVALTLVVFTVLLEI